MHSGFRALGALTSGLPPQHSPLPPTMSAPRLIVGLGNPTAEHATDRHNAGFWFIDTLLRRHPGQIRHDARYHGEVGEVRIGNQVVRLLKPMTYMNRSGQAVGALARFYRLDPADILVVFDELDLLPGSARLKKGGSSTHNGLRDITAHLGTPAYWRLRLGIGHPRTLNLKHSVVDFVLGRPSQADQIAIDEAIDRSIAILPTLLGQGWEIATQQLHAADPEMQAKAAAKAKPKKPAAGTETTTSAGAATTGKTGSETTARAGTEGRPAGDTGSLQSAHASTGPDAAPRVSTGESTGQTSATRPDDVSTSRPGSSPASAATSKSGTDTRSRGALHDAFKQALSRVVPGRNDRDH